MRKIISIFLIFVILFTLHVNFASADVTTVETSKKYETWTQSPALTTDVGREEYRIYKAMDMEKLILYKLPEVGENYYFAIAEAQKSNTGKNGKTNLSVLHCYLLLAVDDGFIIIDYNVPCSDYYWNAGVSIADVSDITIEPSKGARVLYIITPNNKYNVSGWDDYNDYMFITEDKRMAFVYEDNYYGCAGWPLIREGVVYWAKERYERNGSVYSYYNYTIAGDATRIKEMVFTNTSMEYGDGMATPVTSTVTEENGYKSYLSFDSDVQPVQMYKLNGSEDLYFSFSQTLLRNTTTDSESYYDIIEVFKNEYGNFRNVKTYRFDTGKSYSTSISVTELGGIDASWYEQEGYEVPAVDFGGEYMLTTSGMLVKTTIGTNYALYNGRLVSITCKENGKYVTEQTSSGQVYKQMLKYIYISSEGEVTLSEPTIYLNQVPDGNKGQDGFYCYTSSFQKCSSFTNMKYASPKVWWNRYRDNVFDDGRTVECEWYYVGNYYEMWYVIREPNGTVCGIGPTGYTDKSAAAEIDFYCIAVGNSKFIAGIKDVDSAVIKEYYRASVVKETADGDVVSSVSIGNKTLVPPDNTDTVPVQSIIDFGKDNLPIGYNIKDNVISSAKLDSNVRERINAIRLNDIVIIKNTESLSGVQNAGISLEEHEEYDTTMGRTPVVIYTNGQNLCWYCTELDLLNSGTYNRYYSIGDTVVYVTFKIVDVPDNKGVTTVVF